METLTFRKLFYREGTNYLVKALGQFRVLIREKNWVSTHTTISLGGLTKCEKITTLKQEKGKCVTSRREKDFVKKKNW